ncbi:MAG: hypothetical protein ACK5Q5_17160 [Planctomycetaceae bacterium]
MLDRSILAAAVRSMDVSGVTLDNSDPIGRRHNGVSPPHAICT